MNLASYLPIIIGVESAIAGSVYLFIGDWQHAGYWVSAATITFFVTMMG